MCNSKFRLLSIFIPNNLTYGSDVMSLSPIFILKLDVSFLFFVTKMARNFPGLAIMLFLLSQDKAVLDSSFKLFIRFYYELKKLVMVLSSA